MQPSPLCCVALWTADHALKNLLYYLGGACHDMPPLFFALPATRQEPKFQGLLFFSQPATPPRSEDDMVDLSSKTTAALLPTDILFQTPYWAQVKSRLGLRPRAFDIATSGPEGDVLVLLKTLGGHSG